MLDENLKRRIEEYLPRYPSKQAVTLPALHIVQDETRCVSTDAMREIARMLDLSPAEVHDTASFYGFFRTEKDPLGKTRLWVCRSLACQLRGSDELLKHLCDKLGVQPGGTTADGKITLEFAECIGGCDGAPCILVDDKREGRVRLDVADKIVSWLFQLRGIEPASPRLLQAIEKKGRAISFATEGSDERRNLQVCGANALYFTGIGLVIFQEDVRKIEALEEFLHGTQERLKILARLDSTVDAEIHVKRFMLRHRQLLGISADDARILETMLRGYEDARSLSHANS